MPTDHTDDVTRTYYRLRRTLGYLGLALPLTLIAGGLLSLGQVEPSISDYYHTLLRDVFVGTLCAIGMFLIAYRGHARGRGERMSDDLVTTLAGVAALGVAFLPNNVPGATPRVDTLSQEMVGPGMAAVGHYAAAIVLLSCLAWLSFVRFARTSDPRRRRLFRVSGALIALMTVATIIASWFRVAGSPDAQTAVNASRAVLWCETLAIWAFALSWLVKGRAQEGLRRPGPKPRTRSQD